MTPGTVRYTGAAQATRITRTGTVAGPSGRRSDTALRYDTFTRAECAGTCQPPTPPMPRTPALVPTAGRPAWHGLACAGLLLALVVTQWLGVVHASLHVETASAHHDTDTRALPSSNPMAGQTHATWLSGLLDEHGSASDCLLYDQISHGDCAPTPLLAQLAPARPVVSDMPVTAGQAGSVPAWALARGPPRIR